MVISSGLTSNSIGARYTDLDSASTVDFYKDTSCINGNWPARALEKLLQNSNGGSSEIASLAQLVYGLKSKGSTGNEFAFYACGFGQGLSLIDTKDVSASWSKSNTSWTIGCGQSDCYIQSAGNNRNSISRTIIDYAFSIAASIDSNLIMLAMFGSLESDKILADRYLSQSVSYSVLTRRDTSVQADAFRAAYLISLACSVPVERLNPDPIFGFKDFFAIYKWVDRPVRILTPGKIIWYLNESILT
ncbi:hypothetical protein BC833DRAFT_84160 [Globomyces pollinis-pini]|nr:hypothetical protein BC833DRAFT_84160 [Globomyces pollinis-pini]